MTSDYAAHLRSLGFDEEEVASALSRLSWRARRGHKVCASCGAALPVSAFGVDSSRRDGLHNSCRDCRSPGKCPTAGGLHI